jgi:hypothetical protein
LNSFKNSAERGASQKDKAALREHIEFLIFMAGQAKQTELWKSLQVILSQLA